MTEQEELAEAIECTIRTAGRAMIFEGGAKIVCDALRLAARLQAEPDWKQDQAETSRLPRKPLSPSPERGTTMDAANERRLFASPSPADAVREALIHAETDLTAALKILEACGLEPAMGLRQTLTKVNKALAALTDAGDRK